MLRTLPAGRLKVMATNGLPIGWYGLPASRFGQVNQLCPTEFQKAGHLLANLEKVGLGLYGRVCGSIFSSNLFNHALQKVGTYTQMRGTLPPTFWAPWVPYIIYCKNYSGEFGSWGGGGGENPPQARPQKGRPVPIDFSLLDARFHFEHAEQR